LALAKDNQIEYPLRQIDTNLIKDEGCRHLSEAKWPMISQIELGKTFKTKGLTKYLMKDVSK
jgi:hypothetical protein